MSTSRSASKATDRERLMDYEVPECQGFPGVDDALRALDNYYFTPELLLREDDGGVVGGSDSDARENPSPIDLPPSSPLPTYYTAGNPSGEVVVSDAEMASWLCQLYEQEAPDDHKPRGAATATTTEGGNTAPSSCGGTATVRTPTASVAAGGAAEGRRGRSSSGRRRSCSGKAAEQKRRDKINDKMRTLQQLIPRCSKTDKVSTLEEVIKYMKSLQHQVQVMSAIPTTPIFAPPSCMRLAGWQAPAMMPPRYPVFLTAPAPAPHTRRHQEGYRTYAMSAVCGLTAAPPAPQLAPHDQRRDAAPRHGDGAKDGRVTPTRMSHHRAVTL